MQNLQSELGFPFPTIFLKTFPLKFRKISGLCDKEFKVTIWECLRNKISVPGYRVARKTIHCGRVYFILGVKRMNKIFNRNVLVYFLTLSNHFECIINSCCMFKYIYLLTFAKSLLRFNSPPPPFTIQ